MLRVKQDQESVIYRNQGGTADYLLRPLYGAEFFCIIGNYSVMLL